MKPRLTPAPLTEEDLSIWRSIEQVLPVARGYLFSQGLYKAWAMLADRRDAEVMYRREYQRHRFKQLNAPRMPPSIFWATYMVQYV